MFKNTIIKQFSESGILIKFQQKPSRELILLMTHLQSKLKSIYAELILDVNFTYNSY